ncbi:phospholipid/cholesterol/gamma-HCH transport system permease protein [Desulfobaculum xiamenense]|uniref:Phospholipid/cholesterol/gamma-HCH transport system permease protein n=1 Tax=Desulfobaculum xiamenense TaxID=995050 RepID=A0A846QHP0_9BACT|nr:MlaE family lipid ABC transporter permease subunit [Desulfobaculum xiamenense]NJB67721.1 phospholipid/cholesterol/gamma-HCH transport system permease protein [Desulfobaculum xiamenense]
MKTERTTHRAAPTATVSALHEGGLALSGRLDAAGTAAVWSEALRIARAASATPLTVDMTHVTFLDGSGAALVAELRAVAASRGTTAELRGLSEERAHLVELLTGGDFSPKARPAPEKGLITQIGREASAIGRDMYALVAFVGESARALWHSLFRPGTVRWRDYLRTCETAGVNALPIIALIGFLMGLITAFQSAVPMRRFGADIYVANLLGLSMLRELGPLVTAILLAGRSGSAFAAEIGTMTVNEEVDALRTMGLDPVQFLMVPRVLAAMTVTPFLTIFFNLFALLGGAVVVTGFGYPFVVYATRALSNVTVGDVMGGLFKALVFSVLVAGVGCLRGLETGTGASAVGESTTSSVVSGLVLIAVSDGILATIYYALGI